MWNVLLVGIVIWLVCGFFAAASFFAYFQGRFSDTAAKYKQCDAADALVALALGPISLVVELGHQREGYGFDLNWWRSLR